MDCFVPVHVVCVFSKLKLKYYTRLILHCKVRRLTFKYFSSDTFTSTPVNTKTLTMTAVDGEEREPMLHESTECKETENSHKTMEVPKRKLTKVLKIMLCVVVLAIIFIAIAIISRHRGGVVHTFHRTSSFENGFVLLSDKAKSLTFLDPETHFDYLSITFPHKVKQPQGKNEAECQTVLQHQHHINGAVKVESHLPAERICRHFEDDLSLVVTEEGESGCHFIDWVAKNNDTAIENCIDISRDNWYGGGALSVQRWPLNRVNVPLQPFITRKQPSKEMNGEEASFGAVIEPYWVSASGAAVIVNETVPLLVSMNHNNNKRLCFVAATSKPFYFRTHSELFLSYKICKGKTAKSVHRNILHSEHLKHPLDSPKLENLQKPLWSNRGLNLASINEREILNLVQNIKKYKLLYSQLYIDGNYSKLPGSIYFNNNKFPHSHQMIMEFAIDQEQGKLDVGLEVLSELPALVEMANYSVKYSTPVNKHPLDVTNSKAVKWYIDELDTLRKQISLSGFRFSGGQVDNIFQNKDGSFSMPKTALSFPNEYTMQYVDMISVFKDSIIGSAFKNQEHGLVVDAGPMLSSWEHKRGLKGIIPMVLTYGILGYPFVLTGPVGGLTNEIDKSSGHFALPEKDLYIRWLQLATYLPVMELSAGPWEFDEQVTNYTRKMLEFRRDTLWSKHFLPAIKEATAIGTPIARPLWWVAVMDKFAQFIDCEFLLGKNLLVAPVFFPRDRARDIYLPEGGWWEDQLHKRFYKGGQWLRKFPVGLFEIATFERKLPPKGVS